MTRDMHKRSQHPRTDSLQRRSTVQNAMRLIYELKYAINNPHVEKLLAGESLIAVKVSPNVAGLIYVSSPCRMPFPS